MWLGEQITERGVGNGISLLIFAGIVIGLPNGVEQVFDRSRRRHDGDDRRVRHAGGDGRDYRLYRFCRGGATKDSGQLCETSRWAPSCWRTANDHAAEDQHGRRDPCDLRIVSVVDAAEYLCCVSSGSERNPTLAGGLRIWNSFRCFIRVIRITS